MDLRLAPEGLNRLSFYLAAHCDLPLFYADDSVDDDTTLQRGIVHHLPEGASSRLTLDIRDLDTRDLDLVRVRHVPSGTLVEGHHPFMLIEGEAQAANAIATQIVNEIWQPLSILTYLYYAKVIATEFFTRTGGDLAGRMFAPRMVRVGYKRGQDGLSYEQMLAQDMFDTDLEGPTALTQLGVGNELQAVQRALELVKEGPLIIPIDFYNDMSFVSNVLNDDSVRFTMMTHKPDEFGDGILFRTQFDGEAVSAVMGILARLEKVFGVSSNAAGFKLLPRQMRVLRVGGTHESMVEVYTAMANMGWAAENVHFDIAPALVALNQETYRITPHCFAYGIEGEEELNRINTSPICSFDMRSLLNPESVMDLTALKVHDNDYKSGDFKVALAESRERGGVPNCAAILGIEPPEPEEPVQEVTEVEEPVVASRREGSL